MAQTTDQEESVAQTERLTLYQVADAIKKSSATPIFVADGEAMEIGTAIRALGRKQISVVVLA